MELDLSCFRSAERAQLELRALYEKAGYHKYHMSRFEEYSLYQENRRFLSSDQVITFTDLDGRLLALKPDVTLGIAKMRSRPLENAKNTIMWKKYTGRVWKAIRLRRSTRWGWNVSGLSMMMWSGRS